MDSKGSSPKEEIYETATDKIELLKEKTKVRIEDKSMNGTFVNGTRVGKGNGMEIKSGDIIGLIVKTNKEVSVGFRIEFDSSNIV